MKASQSFLATLKEAPSDAEVVSHKLMVRAGLIRKLSAGVYNYLPLGLKVIRKVENIIREIVPVPVFVPTGGNVEAEMAKVRGDYEEINRMAREAAVPSQRTVVPYASTASESEPQQGRGGHAAAAAATDEEVDSTNHDEVAAEAPSELTDVAELDAAKDSGEGGDEAKPADPEKKVEMTV